MNLQDRPARAGGSAVSLGSRRQKGARTFGSCMSREHLPLGRVGGDVSWRRANDGRASDPVWAGVLSRSNTRSRVPRALAPDQLTVHYGRVKSKEGCRCRNLLGLRWGPA
jgi:hypothetical protein